MGAAILHAGETARQVQNTIAPTLVEPHAVEEVLVGVDAEEGDAT
jgi:hypothetical protein